MKILTESELRARLIPHDSHFIEVDADTFITPGAREYLADRGIELRLVSSKGTGFRSMPMAEKQTGYVDAVTGRHYAEKPEQMTHLRGNLLVNKTHPQIAFRGKLDSLEASILETQLTSENNGFGELTGELDEIYSFVRSILSAEVNGTELKSFKLLGMDSAALRYVSQHVREEFGFDHLVPSYKMGEVCVKLNTLRTVAREAELAAATAFTGTDGEIGRCDIIEALNRLSSCIYILHCRVLAGYYKKR